MKLNEVIPPTPGDVADWTDTEQLQRIMVEAVQELSRMAADVGAAKHIIEYDGNRTKRALARAMAAALAGGDSVAKSEAEGRASEIYVKELQQLGKEHQAATTVLTEWEVTKLKWQTAQSLLAMQRESVKRL